MSEPKFFSEEWCREALKLDEAHNPEIRKTLKNPDTFSHVLGFEVADRPGVIVHGQYVEGRPAVWTSENLFPDDQIWAAFRANLEHFQEAVSGKTPAASLVMGGKIRLVRGSMKDAIENAQPLNLLMRLWGTVPTDWDI